MTKSAFPLGAFAGSLLTAAIILYSSQERKSLLGESSPPSMRSAAASSLPPEYCVVHVHGFHHSGTGVARHFINESLGVDLASDMWYDRGEAEGHNKQHVYTCDKVRGKGKRWCLRADRDDSKMWGRIWYCPRHVKEAQKEEDRASMGKQLWEEWAPTWDLSKPYLIQKSPMFDVKLLDRLNIQEFAPQALMPGAMAKGGTFHVVVLRHPLMSWSYFRYMYEYEHLLFNWLDAWEHVLNLFASGSVKKFAVVQYEVMANPDMAPLVKDELKALIRGGCGIESSSLGGASAGAASVDMVTGSWAETSGRHTRRRLEYHSSGGVSEHHLKMGNRFLTACLRDESCRALMADLQPLVGGFGYDIKNLEGFNGGNAGPVLFSYKNLPSMELVRSMRALVDKYIGVGYLHSDPRNPRYSDDCNENCY